MQREARREGLEPLTEQQATAMQARLQRLILHLESRAGFLGREPFEISKDDRLAVNLWKLADRSLDGSAQFEAQQLLIGHVRPVRRVGTCSRRAVVRGLERRKGAVALLLSRSTEA